MGCNYDMVYKHFTFEIILNLTLSFSLIALTLNHLLRKSFKAFGKKMEVEEKEKFMSQVTHEQRTQLNGIKSYADKCTTDLDE
jgi:hypothetical protein